MRRLSCSLLVGIALVTSAFAADVELLRVWPGWRDAESFERISEYFGGGEHSGREVIVRTHNETRAGFYFLVRAKSAGPLTNTRFEVSVIRPDAPEPKTYALNAPTMPAHETVFQLGLTGVDWPGGKEVHPVAWKVALVANDGRVLAEQKSFLWEKPAK